MIEYVMVTSVTIGLLMIMMMLVNSTIMEGPANRLTYIAFTDVGNGLSTRIVDIYAIAPMDGSMTTTINLPKDVAGKPYWIEIGPGINPVDQDVIVNRDFITTKVALAGIGASKGVAGNTTSARLTRISYDSAGYSPNV
jgi:hypothetical protein